MKRFIPVFVSVILGCTLAYVIYFGIEKRYVTVIKGNATAVQIGAFTKLENALKLRDNYGGIVYNDSGVYRVYYAVLKSDKNIDFITEYLRMNGINYYIKSIKLDETCINKLSKYEELMEKSSEGSKVQVNTMILKSIKADNLI